MVEGGTEGGEAGGEQRSIVYCVIPSELALKLHDLLRRHFTDDPNVEVVVERRHRERRGSGDRRSAERAGQRDERRRIHGQEGRRVADRRVPVTEPSEPLPLPRRARRYAEQITFVRRLEPSSQVLEDQETARLVTRFQSGDTAVFTTLYTRYFERVYAYLRVVLKDRHEAEDMTQQVFTQVFEALPRYERRSQPFRGWLFVIVRNHAIKNLRRHSRLDVVAPQEIDRHREDTVVETTAGLDWITDRDLLLFVERLPLAQRQVLVMRYVLGLNSKEMSQALGRTPEDIRITQHRALQYLRSRLGAVRNHPAGRSRARMRGWKKQAPVLRSRRWALLR